MTLWEIVALVALAVVAGTAGRSIVRLWFPRMTPARSAALSTTTLRHYTTQTAGQSIDQGNGTVHLQPRRGLRGALNDVMHQNWAGIRPCHRAVYLYTGVPTGAETKFHGHSNDVVVLVSGADLLALHPGRLYRSWRDTAIAVRGGYEGPGTVQTVINSGPTAP